MSTPAAKPTRQQLEELDALLQRMLSLPVNQAGPDLPPPPVEPPRPMPAPPPMPAMPSMAPMPAPPPPQRRAAPPSGAHAWQVPLPANAGGASFSGWPVGIEALSATATSAVAAPPPPVGRLNVAPVQPPVDMSRGREMPPPMARQMPMQPPVAQTMVQTIVPIPMPLAPVAAVAPLPFYLWPLGLLDSTMGGIMAGFGPPGRWLGQGSGKILIGWAGMLMMAAAAVWGVMDYLGWSW